MHLIFAIEVTGMQNPARKTVSVGAGLGPKQIWRPDYNDNLCTLAFISLLNISSLLRPSSKPGQPACQSVAVAITLSAPHLMKLET